MPKIVKKKKTATRKRKNVQKRTRKLMRGGGEKVHPTGGPIGHLGKITLGSITRPTPMMKPVFDQTREKPNIVSSPTNLQKFDSASTALKSKEKIEKAMNIIKGYERRDSM